MNQQLKITRSELHAAIWSKPQCDLAKDYGISPYQLRSICEEHDIPRPEPGHWNLVRRGFTIEIPPLPPSNSSDLVTIAPSAYRSRPLVVQNQEPSALQGRTLDELDLTLRDSVAKTHKLVRATKAALHEHPNHRECFEAIAREPHLWIDVSKVTLMRALLILDVLVRALESLGFRVEGRHAHIAGENIRFGIYERSEKKEQKHPRFPWRDHTYFPTGVLTFRIVASWKTFAWSDEPGQLLESRLNFLINQILLTADKQKAYDARIAEEHRQWQEKWDREKEAQRLLEQQRAEAQRREQLEQQRRQKLEQAADSWDRARRLNSFLDECANRISRPPSYEDLAFLDWARRHAQRLDPFQNHYLPNAIAELARAGAPITGSNAPSPSPNQTAPTSAPV